MLRSAGEPVVEARGFFVPQGDVRLQGIGSKQTLGHRLRRFAKELPPQRIILALFVIGAAVLFVAYDASRSLGEARERMQLVAKAMALEIGATREASPAMALLRTVPKYDKEIVALLRNPKGEVIAATRLPVAAGLTTMQAPTQMSFVTETVGNAIGTLDLRFDDGATLSGIWLRGSLAIGLAFLISGLMMAPGLGERRTVSTADLLSTIPFGVACWSPDGRLIECNEQYRARLQLMQDQARPGSSYQAAVRNLSTDGYVRLVSEDNHSRLLEFHRLDGMCLLIDERPLSDGGFVTLVSDVTERKKVDSLLTAIREEQRILARRYHEEKLRAEAASRSKTSFLAHLSHDIRTPLNHIIGFAQMLKHQAFGPLGDKRYVGYADTIRESGERLLASFATILDLAEFESGQKVLRAEPVKIDDLILAVSDRFRPQAMRAGLSFVTGEATGSQMVGDRFCLERMLGNLVENAIRFTPTGGKVTVAAFVASDGVVFEITDTGIGMSEEKLASLAQPFVFGDAAFTRDSKDAGLGIAIARAIAELTGGRMAIDSSPALGTTIAISLPLRPSEQSIAAE